MHLGGPRQMFSLPDVGAVVLPIMLEGAAPGTSRSAAMEVRAGCIPVIVIVSWLCRWLESSLGG